MAAAKLLARRRSKLIGGCLANQADLLANQPVATLAQASDAAL